MSADIGCVSRSEVVTCWSHHELVIGATFVFAVRSIWRKISAALKFLEAECCALPIAVAPNVAHKKQRPGPMTRRGFEVANQFEVKSRSVILLT